LYGDDDRVTDHVKLTEFVGVREEAGAEVTVVTFEAGAYTRSLFSST
jgi:hypothetical protein